MHDRIRHFIESTTTKCISWWVKPSVLPEKPDLVLDRNTPIVYVLETGGLADRAALNIVCKQHGLPPPNAALSFGNYKDKSSIHVLKHRKGIIFRHKGMVSSARVQKLMAAGLDQNDSDLQIVPVALYWGREPGKEQKFWSLLFSENWNVASRTRKFFTTIWHGRDTLLTFSEPVSYQSLLTSTGKQDLTQIDPTLLTRKLSRILRVHFRHRRGATLGPDQSHRRTMISQVINDPVVQQIVHEESEGNSKREQRFQLRANQYAYEIAADMSYPTVRVIHRLMNRLWTKIYEGINLNGIDNLKSAADGREIVYVPCHRSHIDYLLLSYILYVNGFSLPHIAAGVNLNLPVVGGLLRRCGAFFLRRSFAGNKLYAAVFNSYLKSILQRGNSVEYFVEGGRSRTGRLLPPKGGMLAMTVHAYLSNPSTPVVFVPVYFGYERLFEGRAFISELAGGKKQKESIFALLKSLRTLREEFGHVYVNFGTPIYLDTLLSHHNTEWKQGAVTAERPEWIKPVVVDLGDQIMRSINQAACITPISLLATALLSTPRGTLGSNDLLVQMQSYLTLFRIICKNTNVIVPEIDLANVIPHGQKLGFIEQIEDPLGQIIAIKPGQASPLTYFRNNIQHLLVIPSIIACSFTNEKTRHYEQLHSMVQYAYPLLQRELFLADEPIQPLLDKSIEALCEAGLISAKPDQPDTWQRASTGSTEAVSLLRLIETSRAALERYYLCAGLLVQAGSDGISTDQLQQRAKECADRLERIHGKESGELFDKHLHPELVNSVVSLGYARSNSDLLFPTAQLLALETEARSMLEGTMRHAILNTINNQRTADS